MPADQTFAYALAVAAKDDLSLASIYLSIKTDPEILSRTGVLIAMQYSLRVGDPTQVDWPTILDWLINNEAELLALLLSLLPLLA